MGSSRAERDVPDRGPRAEAGPGGDEAEDARGCHLLHPEFPHLRGAAPSHSFYLKEAGQHMKTGHHMQMQDMKNLTTVTPPLQMNRPQKM